MDANKASKCNCHKQAQSTQQTITEMEFDRGIWSAAVNNEYERVLDFVHQGKANECDNYNYTALHYAAINGNVEICKLLLDKGKCDVNAVTKAGASALHRAAMTGHLNVVKLLIEHKAQIELCDNDGQTALHRAASRGQLDVCKYLVDLKPTLCEVKDNKDKIPYEYIIDNDDDEFKSLLRPSAKSE